MNETKDAVLPDMEARIVEHGELKLIGIPCIGLNDMGSKYHLAKDSLLGLAAHMPQIVDASVQYGMWPQVPGQDNANMHAYILSVEVSTFDGVPEWFARMTIPPQRCVAVASKEGNFDGAGHVIDAFIKENGLTVNDQGRTYTICERYRYNAEGFARYSLPIVSEDQAPEKLSKLELKRVLAEKYPHREALIKKIETVYIPVRNSQRAKQFFMKHGLVKLSEQGNVKLASGQGIFFLETKMPYTSNFETHDWIDNVENHLMEAFCFEVSEIETLHEKMKRNGARVSELRDSGGCGYTFDFFDPDGNKYCAWQP